MKIVPFKKQSKKNSVDSCSAEKRLERFEADDQSSKEQKGLRQKETAETECE